MGTRAHVRLMSSYGEIKLYRHCDGYPSDFGKSLKIYLDRLDTWDVEYIADQLITHGLPYHDRKGLEHYISPAAAMCGTENYVYVVDCDAKTLVCYEHYVNETYEQCCIPKRICSIDYLTEKGRIWKRKERK